MTVYIVTSGEYSDYGINAVFTSQEQAELYISTMPDSHKERYYIEKYETDESHYEGTVFYGINFSMTMKYNYRYYTTHPFISKKPVEEEIEHSRYDNNYYVTIPTNRFYHFFEDDDSLECKKVVQDWIAKYKYRKEVDEK